MSAVNAMIARGVNPGAGKLQADQARYAMGRDEQVRSRNAFVQDRAFNAQQDYRNSMLGSQQDSQEAAHERWVMGQVQSAQTPEQARAIYEWGIQDAQNRGYDTSAAQPWEAIAEMYVQPEDPSVEHDRRQAAQNAEWDRRNSIQREQSLADARADAERRAAEIAIKELPSPSEVAQTEADAGQFRDMITDENFSDSVGPWDDLTAGFFGLFDTEDYRTNKKVTLAANELILSAASNLKGALSDKDIKFLQDSQPKPSDHESVWVDWYNTRYLTRINAARKELGMDPIAKIQGTGDYESEIDALVAKYAK